LNAYTLITRREPRGIDKKSKLSEVPRQEITNHLSQTRMMTERMMTERMMTERMMTERMMTERMMSERMMTERMMSERMIASSGGSGNPIHSMRNPPVVFFPTACIKDRREVLAIQEKFWERPSEAQTLKAE
jgi:hypothetical protein